MESIRNNVIAAALGVGFLLMVYIAVVRPMGATGNAELFDLAWRCVRFGAPRAILGAMPIF